jgi:hypothetical protein
MTTLFADSTELQRGARAVSETRICLFVIRKPSEFRRPRQVTVVIPTLLPEVELESMAVPAPNLLERFFRTYTSKCPKFRLPGL